MLKLGIIGGGGHAVQSHWRFANAAGFRVSAVADPNEAGVRAELAKYGLSAAGARFVGDAQELPWSDLDAVLIASPDKDHPAHLAAVVAAGKPVLVDKPLAITRGGSTRRTWLCMTGCWGGRRNSVRCGKST